MRGKASVDGEERLSKNGYLYRRVDGKWKLVHRLVAEEQLGRELLPNERCRFRDNDRTNLNPDNIVVYEVKPKRSWWGEQEQVSPELPPEGKVRH